MREYLVDKGKLRGSYNIYDSPAEFKSLLPDTELYRWGEKAPELMKKGDWVRAYDDFVCQIISLTYLISGPDHTTYFVRFPMATIPVKIYKGKIRFYEFYAMFTLPSKGNLRTTQYSGKRDLDKKIKFAAMIMAGVNPTMAYNNAFDGHKRTLHQTLFKIKTLLTDPMIGDLIMQKFTAISEKLNKEITDEDFVEKIVKHWNQLTPSDKNFLPSVKFIGEVTGKLSIDTKTKRELREAEEAELIEDEPPKEISNM